MPGRACSIWTIRSSRRQRRSVPILLKARSTPRSVRMSALR
ncbi:hypothetical protein FQK02_05595 [Xanthomonas vasicola]|nr:hypothetical protein FQK02_05595 [Xanthomonas vasicola]